MTALALQAYEPAEEPARRKHQKFSSATGAQQARRVADSAIGKRVGEFFERQLVRATDGQHGDRRVVGPNGTIPDVVWDRVESVGESKAANSCDPIRFVCDQVADYERAVEEGQVASALYFFWEYKNRGPDGRRMALASGGRGLDDFLIGHATRLTVLDASVVGAVVTLLRDEIAQLPGDSIAKKVSRLPRSFVEQLACRCYRTLLGDLRLSPRGWRRIRGEFPLERHGDLFARTGEGSRRIPVSALLRSGTADYLARDRGPLAPFFEREMRRRPKARPALGTMVATPF